MFSFSGPPGTCGAAACILRNKLMISPIVRIRGFEEEEEEGEGGREGEEGEGKEEDEEEEEEEEEETARNTHVLLIRTFGLLYLLLCT